MSKVSQIVRILHIKFLSSILLPPGWVSFNFSNQLDQKEILEIPSPASLAGGQLASQHI